MSVQMKHQDGEFPIKFLGSGDYYWINHGRTFFYEDGDNERIPSMSSSKSMDASFKRGLAEAGELSLLPLLGSGVQQARFQLARGLRDVRQAGEREDLGAEDAM